MTKKRSVTTFSSLTKLKNLSKLRPPPSPAKGRGGGGGDDELTCRLILPPGGSACALAAHTLGSGGGAFVPSPRSWINAGNMTLCVCVCVCVCVPEKVLHHLFILFSLWILYSCIRYENLIQIGRKCLRWRKIGKYKLECIASGRLQKSYMRAQMVILHLIMKNFSSFVLFSSQWE
jgi:hypothetical protein